MFRSCIVFASLAVAALAHSEYEEMGLYPAREHSISKPYQGTGMTIPHWDFIGNTMVSPNFIRLTADAQSRQGGIWNKVPLQFPYWETIINFKVHGHGKELYGDGMAFWYVKHPMQIGSVFGSADYFWGLGIFMDTYANQNGAHSHGHPYISAMVGNGSVGYDHDRDGTHTMIAGCEAKFRGVEHDTYLSIRYYNDTLSVRTDIDGTGIWEECFSAPDVKLPTGLYLGMTAATGDLSDNHDLISLKTYMLDIPPSALTVNRALIVPSAAHHEPQREHVHDPAPPMTWSRFLFYSFMFLCFVLFAGVGGFVWYKKRSEQSRKRFY